MAQEARSGAGPGRELFGGAGAGHGGDRGGGVRVRGADRTEGGAVPGGAGGARGGGAALAGSRGSRAYRGAQSGAGAIGISVDGGEPFAGHGVAGVGGGGGISVVSGGQRERSKDDLPRVEGGAADRPNK